jgi:hypothetical protein
VNGVEEDEEIERKRKAGAEFRSSGLAQVARPL